MRNKVYKRKYMSNKYGEKRVQDFALDYDFFTYKLKSCQRLASNLPNQVRYSFMIKKNYYKVVETSSNDKPSVVNIGFVEFAPNSELLLLKCALDTKIYEKNLWKTDSILLTMTKSSWVSSTAGEEITAYIPWKVIRGLLDRSKRIQRKKFFI